jgi:hypothetical protein
MFTDDCRGLNGLSAERTAPGGSTLAVANGPLDRSKWHRSYVFGAVRTRFRSIVYDLVAVRTAHLMPFRTLGRPMIRVLVIGLLGFAILQDQQALLDIRRREAIEAHKLSFLWGQMPWVEVRASSHATTIRPVGRTVCTEICGRCRNCWDWNGVGDRGTRPGDGYSRLRHISTRGRHARTRDCPGRCRGRPSTAEIDAMTNQTKKAGA